MILVKILGVLGLPDWKDTALGLAMVVGLIAGWGWGRWAYRGGCQGARFRMRVPA